MAGPWEKYQAKPEEPVAAAESTGPWSKYAQPEPNKSEIGQLLDPFKMMASGLVGPTAAIPLGIEAAARNTPRQILEQQAMPLPEKLGAFDIAEQFAKFGPAQFMTNAAKTIARGLTGESMEQQQERQKQNEITVDRVISKLPHIPGLTSLAESGRKVSENLAASVSPAGKKALADSQVEGSLVKAVQDRSLDELSFGKDPSVLGYALQTSQVLGSIAPIIATALMTKSTKAVTTMGFGMGAGEAVQDSQDYISKLNDADLANASPYFKKMVESGVNPVEARKVVTDKAAEYAAQLQGSVSAFGSAITGKLMTGQFDKLLTGTIKNRLGRIALGATAGTTEEGTQEFLEGVAKDIGINKTVVKEIGEQSFANFVLGGLGGAGPGAYRGYVAKTIEEQNQPKPAKADIDAQMRAALGENVSPQPEGVAQAAPVTPVTPAIITPESIEEPENIAPPVVQPIEPVNVGEKITQLRQQAFELNKDILNPDSGLEGKALQQQAKQVQALRVEADRLEQEAKSQTEAPSVTAVTPTIPEPQQAAASVEAPVETTPKKPFTKIPNDPAIEAQAIAIADEIDKLGDKNFASGFRSRIEKFGNFTKPEDLDFYKTKLLEAQQKAGTTQEMPKETFGIDKYLTNHKADKKRFEEFIPNAPQEVKAVVDKSNQYLQALADKINSLGYKVLDISSGSPQELVQFKNKLSEIAGSTNIFVRNAEHIAKNNRFASPEKMAGILKTLENDFAVADQMLGKEVTQPTEVVQEPVQEELPRNSQAKDVPIIPESETVNSNDSKILNKFNEIIKTYKPEHNNAYEDSFLRAINEDVKSKIEKIAAPAFKKGFISQASVEVAPFNGGWVGGSRIMNNEGGYTSGASIWAKVYPTKQEAINAELDKLRNSARIYKNTKAIDWLDSIDPRATKEGKIAINQARQAEKQAVPKAAKKEKITPVATEKVKPVTVTNVEQAVEKASKKVDYDKIKKAAENQIDQAIKRTNHLTQQAFDQATIPANKKFVTINLPGDGSFKVMNNKERLEEFKKKLTSAIKPKQAGIPKRDWQSANVGFKAESAFKNFLDENEPETAIGIANITKLNIKDVKLTPSQQSTLDKYLKKAKEVGDQEPMMETIKSKPGANVARIAKLLGPQLYGSMSDITNVSVKEMLQNSFDAIKAMIENKKTDSGKIDIFVDKDKRTVAMLDDGSGMSPDTLANVFLTIAGTKKDTEFGSGGFGIAKMLFLFGNEEVEVKTMKDGKISSMYAKGGQLMAALEDTSQAPDIEVITKEEMPNWKTMFPKGHGTFVRVTVPKEFKDQSTGEMKEINFPDSQYDFDVLRTSPLFSNIGVTFNGSSVYGMGNKFDANDYTTFVDAKFDWGTARIYVSNSQRDSYGDNTYILSNGLWQFSDKLKKNPMEIGGKNIPYRFYLDIVSKVKPDEEGYPFQLNRQGFTKEADHDLNLIKNYLVLHYRQKDFSNTIQNFGTVQYLKKYKGKITKSDQIELVPELPKVKETEGIKEGSKVEVKEGKLIVNGKEVPLLTTEDLKNASIDIDSLRIPQTNIDPNSVMIHDNLEISNNKTASQIKEIQRLIEENYDKRSDIRDKITEEQNEDKIEILKDEQRKLRQEQSELIAKNEELEKQKTKAEFIPITTLAKEKFGDRFDKFMFDIGDAFMALRDGVSRIMPPDAKGIDYKDLANEAIGVSFDKEYRGVSILLPFKGLFINPAFPEFIDTPEEAALGMFGTMIHELAHHKVRSHGADFPAEMQRILIKLESSTSFDVNQLKKDFILTVKENKDIIDFLNKEGSNEDNRPIGQRFKDSAYQKRSGDTTENLSKRGQQERGRSELPSELRPSYQAVSKLKQPKPVSAEGTASKRSISEIDELLEKHSRPNTPIHPSFNVKDTMLGSYRTAQNIKEKIAESPLLATQNMVGKVDRAVTYARNKNVWYGTGLDLADFAKYNGELRNGQRQAVASIAVTNAIHAGHVGTQVMMQGALEFNNATQMFGAVKNEKSLANVVRLKHDLEDQLGQQRAANVVNGYFEAKRSRSIINEYLNREAAYEEALESGENPDEAATNLKNIEIAIQKVNMDDEAIDDFIALEKQYPELRKMMDNWTAVNHNQLDMAVFAGVMSKKRGEHLKSIEDYVPWYRIMDDQLDVHSAPRNVRGMTNVGQEKKFKTGQVDRDIDDVVDNMIHNVMMMTRNSMRNYAANRVAMEYGTRNDKGKLRVFPTEGTFDTGVRVNIIANGRRIVIEIADPLVAEAVLGMENIEIPMIDILAFFANGLRRGITTFPVFQVSQLFMDAPTAAWVSGVKNPAAVWAGTFGGFLRALKPNDPIVEMLKSYGIGGYQSSARTPEKELKMEIGLLNNSLWAKTLKTLDHIGDASDYAQRRAVYIRVLKETGDEMQALIQANNVIDFLKRGSGKGAQFVTRTVSFMNAYAQQIDVLSQALAGGGLKGKSRGRAQAQMLKTGMLLTGVTLLYCMAVGADDEYDKLDDQTKLRNIIIPGTKIRLPMHTSASFLFKAIPELIYNKIMKDGTKSRMDNTRLRKALAVAAMDSLLGPNMIPTGVKPVAEIALNHNFFTGGTVTPKGMEKLESFRQYNAATSELGKTMSKLAGGILNPIEMDHLMRGLFGTAGASVMYGSNIFSGDRIDPQAKDNPLYGSFILPDVPRGREDLFYDLKERSDKKYETFVNLLKNQRTQAGQEYRQENKGLIAAHGFVTGADTELKRVNAEIRRIADLPEAKMSGAEKRAMTTRLQEIKNRILEKTIDFREKAGL